MRLEKELFTGYLVKTEALVNEGFSLISENRYVKKYPIFNGDFDAEIMFFKGNISGRMIDNEFGDEYAMFNNEYASGEFIGRLREEYSKILLEIRDHCFRKALFPDAQSERVAKYIEKTYGDKPDFPWDNYPYFGVFRNKVNNRWYGLIMNVDDNKLGQDVSGRSVINIKPPEAMIGELLNIDNIYPGWHMNKKKWISVSLSDYFPDEYVFSLIDMSYSEIDGLSKVRIFPPKKK